MTYASEYTPVENARLDDIADIVRPFAWIAALFFATGFFGYFVAHPL